MDFQGIRAHSILTATKFGLPSSGNLPLIEMTDSTKDVHAISTRLLCLHALAAVAYGFDRNKAQSWTHTEGIDQHFEKAEKEFFQNAGGGKNRFILQIESMWALAWVLQIIESIDFVVPCSGVFVKLLPNLKAGESSYSLLGNAKVRSYIEVARALDLAYCLHWGINACRISGQAYPEKVKPEIIVERRRALEWVWGNNSWESIQLDT